MLFSYFKYDSLFFFEDWFGFSPWFLWIRILVEGVELVVEFSGPPWCDVLGFCDSVIFKVIV